MMANPIELLKNSIICANWQWAKEAYEILTGEKINIKEEIDKTSELIKQIEELLNNYKKIIVLNPFIDIEKCIHTYGENPPEPKDRRPEPPPPPPPPLATGFSTINKRGYYGNESKLVTEDVSVEEIDKNIKKAEIAKERKTKRSPPKKYNVKCSQCEKNFESDRQESKDFGQKCPKCLQDTINGKINE